MPDPAATSAASEGRHGKALRLLKRILMVLLAGIILVTLLGLDGSGGYLFAAGPLFLAAVMLGYKRDSMIANDFVSI